MVIDSWNILIGISIGVIFSYPIWKYSKEWTEQLTKGYNGKE